MCWINARRCERTGLHSAGAPVSCVQPLPQFCGVLRRSSGLGVSRGRVVSRGPVHEAMRFQHRWQPRRRTQACKCASSLVHTNVSLRHRDRDVRRRSGQSGRACRICAFVRVGWMSVLRAVLLHLRHVQLRASASPAILPRKSGPSCPGAYTTSCAQCVAALLHTTVRALPFGALPVRSPCIQRQRIAERPAGVFRASHGSLYQLR